MFQSGQSLKAKNWKGGQTIISWTRFWSLWYNQRFYSENEFSHIDDADLKGSYCETKAVMEPKQ